MLKGLKHIVCALFILIMGLQVLPTHWLHHHDDEPCHTLYTDLNQDQIGEHCYACEAEKACTDAIHFPALNPLFSAEFELQEYRIPQIAFPSLYQGNNRAPPVAFS